MELSAPLPEVVTLFSQPPQGDAVAVTQRIGTALMSRAEPR